MQARARELRNESHSEMDTDTRARSKASRTEEDQEQRMPLQEQRQQTPVLTTLRGVQVLPLAPPRPASSISWLSRRSSPRRHAWMG